MLRTLRQFLPPVLSLSQVRAMSTSALDNARQAAGEFALAVYERAVLTADLGNEGDEDLPAGHLTQLSREESLERLSRRHVGRLAYIARAGVPDIVPVNYSLDGDAILVASGPGPKLQAAERRDLVAFEVDDIDEGNRTGWSVVVVGYARRDHIGQRATAAVRPEPWAAGPRNAIIRIEPKRITGRHLH